jgi:hypothetical protein
VQLHKRLRDHRLLLRARGSDRRHGFVIHVRSALSL